MAFFKNGYFSLGDDGEIDTKRFPKDSYDLAKFIDKIFDNYDDHPSIYYTGNIYRYCRIFKQANRSEIGRGADEFNFILGYESQNCSIRNGNAFFLKCNNYKFKKVFCME